MSQDIVRENGNEDFWGKDVEHLRIISQKCLLILEWTAFCSHHKYKIPTWIHGTFAETGSENWSGLSGWTFYSGYMAGMHEYVSISIRNEKMVAGRMF